MVATYNKLDKASIIAERIVFSALKPDLKVLAILICNWKQICGNSGINLLMHPLKFQHASQVLVVGVSDGSASMQLHYLKTQLIHNINLYLSRNIVKDIKFIIAPEYFCADNEANPGFTHLDDTKYKQCLEEANAVDDLDLQEKLAKLLYSIRFRV